MIRRRTSERLGISYSVTVTAHASAKEAFIAGVILGRAPLAAE